MVMITTDECHLFHGTLGTPHLSTPSDVRPAESEGERREASSSGSSVCAPFVQPHSVRRHRTAAAEDRAEGGVSARWSVGRCWCVRGRRPAPPAVTRLTPALMKAGSEAPAYACLSQPGLKPRP